MLKKLKESKGFVALETSIVFFVSFLVVLMLFSMVHIMYEQVRLNSLARDAASRGAVIYSVLSKDMDTGRIGNEVYETGNVYWRLFNSGKAERTARINDYLERKLNKNIASTEKYSDDVINVTVKDYYIYKRIRVDIETQYKAPLGSVMRLFGLDYPYTIRASAEAAVSEPAEMIRNVDFVVDVLEKSKAVRNFEEKWSKGIDKLTELING